MKQNEIEKSSQTTKRRDGSPKRHTAQKKIRKNYAFFYLFNLPKWETNFLPLRTHRTNKTYADNYFPQIRLHNLCNWNKCFHRFVWRCILRVLRFVKNFIVRNLCALYGNLLFCHFRRRSFSSVFAVFFLIFPSEHGFCLCKMHFSLQTIRLSVAVNWNADIQCLVRLVGVQTSNKISKVCVCVSVCASSLSIDRVKIAIGKIESPQRGQQHQSTTTKCDMFFVNILALCDFVASVPFNRTAERLKIQRNWLKRKGREAERASKKSQYLTFSISRKLASNFNFPTRNQCNVNAAACEAKMPSEKCSFSKSISVCCRIDKKLERKSEFDKIRLVASVFGVAAAVCCLCFWFRIGVVIVVDCFGQRTTESKSKSKKPTVIIDWVSRMGRYRFLVFVKNLK